MSSAMLSEPERDGTPPESPHHVSQENGVIRGGGEVEADWGARRKDLHPPTNIALPPPTGPIGLPLDRRCIHIRRWRTSRPQNASHRIYCPPATSRVSRPTEAPATRRSGSGPVARGSRSASRVTTKDATGHIRGRSTWLATSSITIRRRSSDARSKAATTRLSAQICLLGTKRAMRTLKMLWQNRRVRRARPKRRRCQRSTRRV